MQRSVVTVSEAVILHIGCSAADVWSQTSRSTNTQISTTLLDSALQWSIWAGTIYLYTKHYFKPCLADSAILKGIMKHCDDQYNPISQLINATREQNVVWRCTIKQPSRWLFTSNIQYHRTSEASISFFKVPRCETSCLQWLCILWTGCVLLLLPTTHNQWDRNPLRLIMSTHPPFSKKKKKKKVSQREVSDSHFEPSHILLCS